MSAVRELTEALISRRSITPEDAGCQELISARLTLAGFDCQQIDFANVKNLWASHGSSGPVLVFLGHTDVVPSGPAAQWHSDPFVPTVRDGNLYGRGAADMKSGVAAFVIALEQFVAKHPNHPGTIALLVTSDEEGEAVHGVRKIAEHFKRTGQKIDYCVTGEPSSSVRLGDVLRIGRRGSLSGVLHVRGVQGHVAYPEKSVNPIHKLAPALAELCARQWDQGYESFPATSFQCSNIHSGTGADNVVPGELELVFNFRFNPNWSSERLQIEVETILSRYQLDYSIKWRLSGEPFLTRDGKLRTVCRQVLQDLCAVVPDENTKGGTSDARFIAPLGAECVELGPVNASIHKIDECVDLQDLEKLPEIFFAIAEGMLITMHS